MQQSSASLHESNAVEGVLQRDRLLERRLEMPVLERVEPKTFVVLDDLVHDVSQILAVGQRVKVLVEIGLARVHEVDLLRELLGELALARAEVALDRDYQAVLAELAQRRVGHLAPQAVVFLLVVPRFLEPLADLIDRELAFRCFAIVTRLFQQDYRRCDCFCWTVRLDATTR